MSADPTIGMIVPPAAGRVPPDALKMCPEGVRFIAEGLGVATMTAPGFDAVQHRIEPSAKRLRERGADAIVLIGTSLSFYRGAALNEELTAMVGTASGLPAVTMSTAVVEGFRALGARRLTLGTAYVDETNERLRVFLSQVGFEILALEALGIAGVEAVDGVGQEDVWELGMRAGRAAPNADALFISCGGLHTLDVTPRLEQACGMPVVSSTPAAIRAGLRLVGRSDALRGYGRLLELPTAA